MKQTVEWFRTDDVANLPKPYEYVLIYDGYGDVHVGCRVHRGVNEWYWTNTDGRPTRPIIFWMPIPIPKLPDLQS